MNHDQVGLLWLVASPCASMQCGPSNIQIPGPPAPLLLSEIRVLRQIKADLFLYLLTGNVLILVVSVRAISVGVCSAPQEGRSSCTSLAGFLDRALQANW